MTSFIDRQRKKKRKTHPDFSKNKIKHCVVVLSRLVGSKNSAGGAGFSYYRLLSLLSLPPSLSLKSKGSKSPNLIPKPKMEKNESADEHLEMEPKREKERDHNDEGSDSEEDREEEIRDRECHEREKKMSDKKQRAKERREKRRQEISLLRTIPYSDHQRYQLTFFPFFFSLSYRL